MATTTTADMPVPSSHAARPNRYRRLRRRRRAPAAAGKRTAKATPPAGPLAPVRQPHELGAASPPFAPAPPPATSEPAPPVVTVPPVEAPPLDEDRGTPPVPLLVPPVARAVPPFAAPASA